MIWCWGALYLLLVIYSASGGMGFGEVRTRRPPPRLLLGAKGTSQFLIHPLVLIIRGLRLRRIPHWQECPSFDSLLSLEMAKGLGHPGKGWIVCDTTTRLPYLKGLFYPCWDRFYRFTAYRSSVADCQALI